MRDPSIVNGEPAGNHFRGDDAALRAGESEVIAGGVDFTVCVLRVHSLRGRFGTRRVGWRALRIPGDRRKMPFLKDGSVGLVITSPSIWNKADYGSLESNIGSIENYGSLKSMRTPLSR